MPGQGGEKKGVEDIFAQTEASGSIRPIPTPENYTAAQAPAGVHSQVPFGPPSALSQGKLQPYSGDSSTSGIPKEQMSGARSLPFPFKKLIIIIIISIAIIGGAIGAFALWQKNNSAPAETPVLGQPADNTPSVDSTPAQDESAQTPDEPLLNTVAPSDSETGNTSGDNNSIGNFIKDFQQRSVDNVLDPLAPNPALVDSDQDGLTDAQEFEQGTNPRLVDSDNDGLSDWEEVAIFGTDPLNRDTDSDTYLDGEEVQNGYNPNGPGKLLDFEKAKTGAE